MSKWLQINPQEADISKKKETHDGVTIEVSISPYDIPEAVRGFQEEDSEWFVIEFRYLTEEPTKMVQRDNNTRFVVGKNSHRIYQIHINVKATNTETIELRLRPAKTKENIYRALDEFNENHPSFSKSLRRDMMHKVIDANHDALFAPMG